MKTFINTSDQSVWSFEDDVKVDATGGLYTFKTVRDEPLAVPETLQPYDVPAPTDAELLATARAEQAAILSSACWAAITGGFTSAALGDAVAYPSQTTDQSNMHTVAACPDGGRLWCLSAGVWARVEHTQAQAQAVLQAFAAWLDACQAQLVTLTARVNEAQSPEIVAWTMPSQ